MISLNVWTVRCTVVAVAVQHLLLLFRFEFARRAIVDALVACVKGQILCADRLLLASLAIVGRGSECVHVWGDG